MIFAVERKNIANIEVWRINEPVSILLRVGR
jgi:hypothetical protein